MPGLPGIIVGRNNYISWGVVTLTSGGNYPIYIIIFKINLDNSDLFVEELSED